MAAAAAAVVTADVAACTDVPVSAAPLPLPPTWPVWYKPPGRWNRSKESLDDPKKALWPNETDALSARTAAATSRYAGAGAGSSAGAWAGVGAGASAGALGAEGNWRGGGGGGAGIPMDPRRMPPGPASVLKYDPAMLKRLRLSEVPKAAIFHGAIIFVR